MPENMIVVEQLSKRYLIGHRSGAQYRYVALRDVIGREFRSFMRKTRDVIHGQQVVQGDEVEEFWALKNINFEVKEGEVLGIVGRNGAGKSTLLKVLSRITAPTDGRIVLNGRVSSLLEVGTGFHPELTGRENIFLNGAILGMAQREIRTKFDEIVAFAEVEKFIDTPVKHYSSGMYVRLAFAVAAHLEPEILIVDEVLAVGDTEFQRKCVGKMNDVSRKQGRTVLFVSHNMEVLLKLCTRGILFDAGHVRATGSIKTIVSSYLDTRSASPRVIDLLSKARQEQYEGKVRLARIAPSEVGSGWSFPFGKPFSIDLSVVAEPQVTQVEVAIGLYSMRGFEVASWTNKCSDKELRTQPGINSFRIDFQDLKLLPGHYFLGIGLRCGRGFEDWLPEAVMFDVISSPEAAEIDAQTFGGIVVP